MRETSYHAVIAEMTVRSLWETQNVMDCIPDELWQHLYHALHSLNQWFINPKATDFVEQPIHTPHLQDLAIYPSACVDRAKMDEYFYTIKAIIVAETDLCSRTLEVGETFPPATLRLLPCALILQKFGKDSL